MAYLGMQGTGDWADPDLRPLDYKKMAFKLFPDSPTPFTKYLSMINSRKVTDPEFKIFEWRLPDMAFVGDTADATTTTIPITAPGSEPGKGLKEGDILENETSGEQMILTAAPVDPWTDLIVIRHWGGTATGVGVIAGDILRWNGSAYAEGTPPPTAVSRRASVVTNFCQIMKDSADLTGTAEQTEMRPFKPWPQLKGEALERHMMKMESAFLRGVQNETTGSNGKPLRTTAGFRPLVVAANGAVDMSSLDIDKLEDALQVAFTYGSKKKMALVGYTALNYVNKVVRLNSTFQYSDPISTKQTYGLNIRELQCPFGTLAMIPHPLMAESALYTTELYIIDPKYCQYTYLRGRDTKWDGDANPKGYDEKLGYYMSECGLTLGLPEVHAVWTGISSLAS